jgi:hypothetical protein
MTTPPVRLDDLIDHVRNQHPDGDALQHLADAMLVSEHLGALADQLLGHFVDQARRTGASWAEIGRSMGVSKQAAQKRFVPSASDRPDRLPGGVFDRFTKRARNVVLAAEQEARGCGHNQVDTTHLVLGLLHEPKGLAGRAIEALGVTHGQVREAIVAALPPAAGPVPDHLPFTRHARKVRDLTLREALRLGHNYVGTEHILLALLRDSEATGATVLVELGVTRDRAESWLLSALDDVARKRRREP